MNKRGGRKKSLHSAKSKYYEKFEARRPALPQSTSSVRTMLFQLFGIIFLMVGTSYLLWRWTVSLNPDALWFSVPLVLAETFMFGGSVLMIINHWSQKVLPQKPPVRRLSDIESGIAKEDDRPLKIDLYIATYNEELAIVEDTVHDACCVQYPHDDVAINIYLCDDGRRDGSDTGKENFKALAEQYDIHYLKRPNNKGFKAGNLNHAFWQTDGDFIVILDADTRLYPKFLANLTGYFRDEKMAWVQSPQWFYDLPMGESLAELLHRKFGNTGYQLSKWIPSSSSIRFGANIFGTAPNIFYDAILRSRNASNAAFCCGAGSIHRRKALASLIKSRTERLIETDSTLTIDQDLIKNQELYATLPTSEVVGPFVHHISEDIYTSILLHSEQEGWRSYQHPYAECKMLSPQTLSGYVKQFSRYAEGTFELFFSKENPIWIKGLSLWQRLAYFETIYSYFSPFWIVVLLVSPIIFFFTLIPPLKAFNFDFFLRFLIFYHLNLVVATLANWGHGTKRSEQYFISSFWYKLKAFFKIATGGKALFNPTSKSIKSESWRKNLRHIYPHLIITILTVVGFLWNLYLIIINVHPSYSAFTANSLWAFYNIYQLNPMMRAAFKTT